jgi:hypothetical protein
LCGHYGTSFINYPVQNRGERGWLPTCAPTPHPTIECFNEFPKPVPLIYLMKSNVLNCKTKHYILLLCLESGNRLMSGVGLAVLKTMKMYVKNVIVGFEHFVIILQLNTFQKQK